MGNIKKRLLLLFLFIFSISIAQEHPKLILTKNGVREIQSQLGKVPLFDRSLEEARKEVDQEIALGIQVPIPKDFSGGYTHERHKRNFMILQKAGVLFQILEEEKYARYIKEMLFAYEAMYNNLPLHPQERSYSRGKLFWQCLNDSNWLVYVSQAYDCVFDWLTPSERDQLETNLFRPYADFISIENPQFFNRVHNHSTWGIAAVGMIGLVMDDEGLIDRALNGIENDGLEVGAKDNDGGFIKVEGQKAGFLANIDEPFSPDGFYTEGPYYQRYAMYPFLIFAEALNNSKPEIKIFEYKNGVLLKAVNTLLNLTDLDGEFYPINDAQKGMSYFSRELVTAVDIAYHFGGENPGLLSIAEKQNQVTLDYSGLAVALGIKEGRAKPIIKESVNLTDGPEGNQGGLAILRQPKNNLCLVYKYTAQGLSHGHYDKLSFSLYQNGREILQDYGLARFVNIEHKGGGNYLKENSSWAKQSIAHNTVVQDKTSHFEGKYEVGSQHHSALFFYDASNRDFQIVSAKEANAYPGTQIHRTLALINQSGFDQPFVLDIVNIESDKIHQYDLPFYYLGQLMKINFEYSSNRNLTPLGDGFGYQHIWAEAKGEPKTENIQITWLNEGTYYSLTSLAQNKDVVVFGRIGANDPEFNLRRDPAIILRRKEVQNTTFVSILEPHGSYSPVSEFSVNSESNIKKLSIKYEDKMYICIEMETKTNQTSLLFLSKKEPGREPNHELKIDGKNYSWKGPYHFKTLI